MIVSIAQPAYWMWSGLVQRIGRSDLHVVLDHVTRSHGDFTNRNRVRTRDGWTWLTVPIYGRGPNAFLPIADVPIDRRHDWAAKHLRTLEHAYARAQHFAALHDALRELYRTPFERLGEVCAATTRFTLDAFGVRTPLVTSTSLAPSRTKSDLVLEICRAVGATEYLSGPFGRDYLDEASFAAAGIAVRYHDFVEVPYAQAQPGAFEPRMAAIDLLFNCGPQAPAVVA
jgi:hypothetical protein